MDELTQSLARFNRAEPDLLFRDAFGQSTGSMELSDDFLFRLRTAVGIEVPKSAWWSAEYPFNALAGALLLYTEGEGVLSKQPRPNAGPLIKSGRQDVDFLISFESNLVLIEAKAYTANDTEQIKQKLKHLGCLKNFQEGLSNARSGAKIVHFHFLLASPRRPKKLDDIEWPIWATRKGKYMWMSLAIDETRPILQAQRCSEVGKKFEKGGHWKIVQSRVFSAPSTARRTIKE